MNRDLLHSGLTRRRIVAAAGLSAALLLPACADLGGPPRVTVSERELAALAQRAFPVERRVLEVLDASVSNPRLHLLPERNRLAAVLDLGARDRVFGGTWQGQIDFDAALRWEPSDQTVRLTQVRVQDLRLATSARLPPTTSERIAAVLAERVLEEMALYRLPPERAEQLRRAGLAPGAVTVTARGVEITFASLAR